MLENIRNTIAAKDCVQLVGDAVRFLAQSDVAIVALSRFAIRTIIALQQSLRVISDRRIVSLRKARPLTH